MDDPDSSTQVAVADPVTGELLEALDSQPPAALAAALYHVRRRKAELRASESALEAELRRRVEIRDRTVFVFGDYEVSAKPQSRREWDADALEGALRELLDQGVLQAGELTEVIHHETAVNGTEAQRLLSRLQGDARKAVERCFTWRQKGPARVEVQRSAQLIPKEV